MLELDEEQTAIDIAWEKADLKSSLPREMVDFFEQHGTLTAQPGCRRAYLRFYLRGKAILYREGIQLGVYTADASRKGLCFLSPVQLVPKERCRIQLPKTRDFQIEIVRCRRLDENCYECGAMFVLGTI